MSRIGNQPIKIPSGVQLLEKEHAVEVSGPRGVLAVPLPSSLKVHVEDSEVRVERESEDSTVRALHGTVRANLANAVRGVTEGFEKRLVLEGLGYRAHLEGEKLVLEVGFSHPVEYIAPEGITLKVEGREEIVVEGASRQLVGQVAAEIRNVRPPEPYKGKGIRYKDEVVRRKPGKAAKLGEGFGSA